MRVLLFSSTYAPNRGGVETVTGSLARHLIDRGHQVKVITNRYPRSLPSTEMVDGVSVRRRLFPNLVPSPGRRPAPVLVKQILSTPLAAAELAWLTRTMKREGPDIVNIHYLSYPALYALVAARAVGIPTVLSFHGSDVALSPYPTTYPFIERWASSLAHASTANSEDLAAYILRNLSLSAGEKLSVIPFGIDDWTEGLPSESGREGDFALVAARLVEKKGVDIAIEALAKLPDHENRLRLKIAGDGPLRDSLERLADRLGVADRIDFVGMLTPPALRELIGQCRFVVVPSHWEAYGVIALEAMIAGRAVIAADGGGITEIVRDGETGIVVAAADAAATAEAMGKLFSSPERAASLGRDGRSRALSEFSWDLAVTRYEQLFTQIASAA